MDIRSPCFAHPCPYFQCPTKRAKEQNIVCLSVCLSVPVETLHNFLRNLRLNVKFGGCVKVIIPTFGII